MFFYSRETVKLIYTNHTDWYVVLLNLIQWMLKLYIEIINFIYVYFALFLFNGALWYCCKCFSQQQQYGAQIVDSHVNDAILALPIFVYSDRRAF